MPYSVRLCPHTGSGVRAVCTKHAQKTEIGENNGNLQMRKGRFFRDREWTEYRAVSAICQEQIREIRFPPAGTGGAGIGFVCRSGSCLWIYDAGDVIAARVMGA